MLALFRSCTPKERVVFDPEQTAGGGKPYRVTPRPYASTWYTASAAMYASPVMYTSCASGQRQLLVSR